MNEVISLKELDIFNSKPLKYNWQLTELIENLKENQQLSEVELDYFRSLDVYDSIHIEGNSLTRTEVTAFLENGITIHGKPFKDFLECKNYEKALSVLKLNLNGGFELTEFFIKSLHKLVTSGIIDDEFVGKYRKEQVVIRGSSWLPPGWTEVPENMRKVVQIYNDWDANTETRFENIIRTMYEFERAHPFIDGNGRTGRLLMNYLLLRNGYPFMWINSVYRAEYLQSFKSWEQCLTFHADRMLTMFRVLDAIRNGSISDLENI